MLEACILDLQPMAYQKQITKKHKALLFKAFMQINFESQLDAFNCLLL